MFNNIQLIGNVTHIPEIHLKEDGRAVAIFSLATSTYWKVGVHENGEQGHLQKKTEWHRILVLRESVVTWVKKALNKGDLLLVQGRLCYIERGDRVEQQRKVAHIVISDREGQVTFLRRAKTFSEDQNPRIEGLDKCSFSENDSHASNKNTFSHENTLPAFLTTAPLPGSPVSNLNEDRTENPSFESPEGDSEHFTTLSQTIGENNETNPPL